MHRKTAFLLLLGFIITSCESLDSMQKGLKGEKRKTSDEFLIQKKSPLILPPDFESLPTPGERIVAKEEISNFEKTLKKQSTVESSSSSNSAEESILKRIKEK